MAEKKVLNDYYKNLKDTVGKTTHKKKSQLLSFVYIQLCSICPSNKRQTYACDGGLQFVDVSEPIDDVTLEVLKSEVNEADIKDLVGRGVRVELLATKREPLVFLCYSLGN